jgi:hypothetical protein
VSALTDLSDNNKLVPQLLRVVTFEYDLCFRHVISCLKFIFDNYTLGCKTLTLSTV